MHPTTISRRLSIVIERRKEREWLDDESKPRPLNTVSIIYRSLSPSYLWIDHPVVLDRLELLPSYQPIVESPNLLLKRMVKVTW